MATILQDLTSRLSARGNGVARAPRREDLLATAGETLAYAEDYFETKVELIKLDVADKGTRLGASAIAGAVVAVLGLAGGLFLSIALALWLGYLVGSYPLGFVIVGLLFLLIAGLTFAFRKPLLTKPILTALISSLFKDPDAPKSVPPPRPAP